MRFMTARRARVAAVAAAAAAALVTGVVAAGAGASATPGAKAAAGPAPVVAGSDYLALGDSVSFGYREPTTHPKPIYKDQATFVGYPEDVAAALGLHLANAACPGETSASLINAKARSNGCERTPGGKPGYRAKYPLHVKYAGSQLAFGLSYLEHHPDTRLVTLMIGANDAFLCQETTKDHCAKQLPAVLKTLARNVARILTAIRQEAHYSGQIVLVPYYSLDYASSVDNAESQVINSAMVAGAKGFGVEVAGTYHAMAVASQHSGYNDCKAGLLTQLTGGTCGIHPTAAGQAILAQAVDATVVK